MWMCSGIVFGAACTLNYMGTVLRQAVETLPYHQTEVFRAVLEQLRWFAGQQIRNVAVSLTLFVFGLALTRVISLVFFSGISG